ncbi:ABC transporter permease subunit [Desulfopila sp. IMCC35006]|nr:ABC transporter permease subunit [Desulfopila sp. IMCC35006]
MMLFLGWPLLSSGQFFVLLTREWLPSQEIYGIYPMIAGSMTIALLALCLSLPISLGTAFVAATLAPRRLRKVVLVTVRFMAGIPTVIYGFVAVFLLVPFMREQLAGGSGLNILTASMVLALLIAPTMIVFFVNGLGNVARSYCLAVDALGGKPVQKLLYLQLPQAWPTVLAGIILGFGRAMGDTLISLMLAGNSIAIPRGVFDSGRTLTAHIALVLAADFASMEFKSIFACGLVLYIFSVIVVILLRYLTGALVRPPG